MTANDQSHIDWQHRPLRAQLSARMLTLRLTPQRQHARFCSQDGSACILPHRIDLDTSVCAGRRARRPTKNADAWMLKMLALFPMVQGQCKHPRIWMLTRDLRNGI